MAAGKYCNREIVITEPNTMISEAERLMCKRHVGDLVVVNKQDDQISRLASLRQEAKQYQ